MVRNCFAATFTGLALSMSIGGSAHADPVDCDMLLCIPGGWPSDQTCIHAKQVFIQRITPYPILPPLQIWNCPMGGTASGLRADIDISGPDFDFVRAIRAWDIRYEVRFNNLGECNKSEAVRLDTYGEQGNYISNRSSIDDVPSEFGYEFRDCSSLKGQHIRSVTVEWQDREGNRGFETVDY